MTSLTSSPPIHSPVVPNSIYGGGGAGQWSGKSKKRRPVDPEETGFVATSALMAPYDSEVAHLRPHHAKRPRTIDDVLGSLSLRPPDPPGNFGNKRKSDEEDEDSRSTKVMRSSDSSCASSAFEGRPSINIPADGTTSASPRRQMDPSGRKGVSPNVTSDVSFNPSTQNVQEQIQQQLALGSASNAAQSQSDNLDIDMSIDDSDHESDSSVSEGSIRNAMYQLVFGRKNNPPPSLNGSIIGCGPPGRCYDAVDSKIEDLIRRSRLEAAIKSQKTKETGEENAATTSDDMDMDDINDGGEHADEDDEWNPGHG